MVYEYCSEGDLKTFLFSGKANIADNITDPHDNPKLDGNNDTKINRNDRPKSQPNNSFIISENTTIPSRKGAKSKTSFDDNSELKTWTTRDDTSSKLISFDDNNFNVDKFSMNSYNINDIRSNKETVVQSLISCSSPHITTLTFESRLYILYDIAKGMEFLHSKNMLHRDLKTENILVHYDSNRFVAKVCDFGSSRKVDIKRKNSNSKQIKDELNDYYDSNNNEESTRKIPDEMSFTHLRGPPKKVKFLRGSIADSPTMNELSKDTESHSNRLIGEVYYSKNLGSIAFTAPEILRRVEFTEWESQPKIYRTNSGFNENIRKKSYSKSKKDKYKLIKHLDNETNISFRRKKSTPYDYDAMYNNDISDKGYNEDANDYIDINVAKASDVFSFGVIMWEVISLKRIYADKTVIEIRDYIVK